VRIASRLRPLAALATLAALAAALLVPASRSGAQTTPRPDAPAAARAEGPRASEPRERAPQPRPHSSRVAVDPARVRIDDGDTFEIAWSERDTETVRILGIDTPETAHPQHDLPYAQAFGPEARAFARGAFAAAERVEVLRTPTLDPYGRTLGYAFLNGKNYSVLVVRAGLAEESITRYGDNGLPDLAAEVVAAAKATGPRPFESPADFRRRMRDLTRFRRENPEHPRP
jgi:endonuclease YncB( thermonuclease family)